MSQASAILSNEIMSNSSKNAHEIPVSARIKEFLSYDGLSDYSGFVNKEDFIRFIIKEAIDNALDVRGTKRITIKIWRINSILNVSVSNYEVVNEDDYITKGKIEDILRFDYSTSSKNAKHVISRGTKGNALQTSIGMSYCFWNEKTRPEFTTEITSNKLRFKIKLVPHDEVIDHLIEEEPTESIGTTTFLFKLNIENFTSPKDVIWLFSRLNKNILFDYSCDGENPLVLNTDHSKFKNLLHVDQGYGQIDTYSCDNWIALKGRELSCVKTSKNTVRQFIEGFQGFSHSAAKVCKKVGIDQGELLLNINDMKFKELFNYMKTAKLLKKPRKGAKDFPSLYETLRVNEDDAIKWASGLYPDNERGRSIPFIVEAVAFKKRDKKACLYSAINFSPNLHSPFIGTHIKGSSNDDDIYEIVEKSGLDVILHLICPAIHWTNVYKGEFNKQPFIGKVFDVIKGVCKKHYSASMGMQDLINSANEVLDSHPNSPYSIREIHYKLLSTKPEYKNISSDPYSTLKKDLSIARKTRGNRGLSQRMLDPDRIVDNSRPAFKNNPSHHSFSDYLSYAYKKLVDECDLERWESQECLVEVWIEKEALSRIIKPTCEKYKVNLFVGKGYSSFTQVYTAIRDRFPRDGRKFVILYFGDHDRTGLKIEDSLKERIIAEAKMQGILLDMNSINFKRCALLYEEQIQKNKLMSIPMTKKEIKAGQEYVNSFGPQKWELDVLEPEDLIKLTEDGIKACITNWQAWNRREAEVESIKQLLREKYCS